MAGTITKTFVGGNVDFSGNQLLNITLQLLAADPGGATQGRFYANTTSGPKYYDGAVWRFLDVAQVPAGYIPMAKLATDPLARANHTGQQTASTISDFGTVTRAVRLDEFTAPTNPVSFGGQRQTNVADPINPQDSATKAYVDNGLQSAAAGIDSKPSVRLIVRGSNSTLSGLSAIDGVTPVGGDRILVTAQTTASQNGVYVAAAGSWARAADADQTGELTPGAFWFVEEGTTYGKTQWRIENTGTITVGTTAITINQFGAAAGYTAGNGISIAGNSIAVTAAPSGGITVGAGGVAVDATVGRIAKGTIGDGTTTSIPINHNLNNAYPNYSFWDTATKGPVELNVTATNANTLTVSFVTAPAAGAYGYTISG